MSEAWLGVDVGTTATKAAVVDARGRLLAAGQEPYADGHPGPHPPDWWTVVAAVVRRLPAGARVAVRAIGVCGRGGGVAFLDDAGQPVALPWVPIVAGARSRPLPRRHRRLARWGALAAAARAIAPAAAARTTAVLTVKDYVNFRLTGIRASDPFSAACRRWPADPARHGIPPGWLPPLRQPATPLGGLTAAAARTLGLRAGTPVAVGGHDGVCANIGAGMLEAGEGCLTLGTLGVVRLNTARPVHPTRRLATFTYPFLGTLWTSGGDVTAGGSALVWLARLLGFYDGSVARFEAARRRLDRLAAGVAAGADGVLFLPCLAGMLSPAERPDAAGVYAGLRAAHGPGHLVRATMEGVALALRDILERLEARGHPAKALRLTGGGTRSGVWPSIIAAVVGRPLGLVAPEASARGAAILATVADERYPDVAVAVRRMVREIGRLEPDDAARVTYERALARFRALMDATLRS